MKIASKAVIVTAVLAAALASAQTNPFMTTQPAGAGPAGTSESGFVSKRSGITKDTTVTGKSGNRSTGKAPLPSVDTTIVPNGVMPGGASSGSMGIRAGTVESQYPGYWPSVFA